MMTMDLIKEQSFENEELNGLKNITELTSRSFYECTFQNCDFSGTDFSGSLFSECKFNNCNLSLIVLIDSKLQEV
ncbi:MAG: pentapeptide repeat-containing protein, partial [Calditrichaceae bacterium]